MPRDLAKAYDGLVMPTWQVTSTGTVPATYYSASSILNSTADTSVR